MRKSRMKSEPFSSVDIAWLRIDVPTNMAIITGVMIFDEPLDLERFKVTIESRLLCHERFRQRVREKNGFRGSLSWELDPNFDLEAHLLRTTLPPPGGLPGLQALAGHLMGTPFLLIGFYYRTVSNGNAAMKASLVTRVGDVFMAVGLFILLSSLGTLNIQELLARAPQHFREGDTMIRLATLLLLGGAVGKSAQLTLQTWLADAMAGPTPVSALIHAATMVTAGVYLIARTHGLFLLAPDVLLLVGAVGAATLLIAGLCALVQTDIKRVLAYSTMSQIGFRFLALGVGAWSAAILGLILAALAVEIMARGLVMLFPGLR